MKLPWKSPKAPPTTKIRYCTATFSKYGTPLLRVLRGGWDYTKTASTNSLGSVAVGYPILEKLVKRGKNDWEWEKGEGDPHGKVAVSITCS